jgi:hypothetical protein
MLPRFARGGAGLLGAAATLLVLSAPAAAAPAPLGFGLQALGHRSYFVFDARPGETAYGRLLLTNTTTQSRIVNLRPADALTAVTGGLDYGQPLPRPKRTGRWLRLAERRVLLPGSGAREIDFVVRVPRGARAGDHLAGIVAFGRKQQARRVRGSSFQLRLVPRMAMAVWIRVPGPRAARLDLRSSHVEVTPTGAFLGLRLRNAGNTLLRRTTGRVVPRTEITYPVPWKGRPVEGDYEVRGLLRPRGGRAIELDKEIEFGQERIKEFRRETGKPATESRGASPAVLGLLVLAVLALALVGGAYLRLLQRVR